MLAYALNERYNSFMVEMFLTTAPRESGAMEMKMKKAYELAELFLNTQGVRGEKELRELVANGGDINEKDAGGMSAMDIALCDEMHDKKMKLLAPKLVEIIKSLQ